MTEERGRYRLRPERRDRENVEHIGDLLRQYVDEQGWDRRLLAKRDEEPRVKGRRRDG